MGVVGRLDQYASILVAEFDDYSMSENLISHSGIPYTSWATINSAIITYNSSTSPDGTTNATQIAAPALVSGVYTFTPTLTSGTVYTYSLFVKAVSGSNTIYFGTDSGTNALVQINTSTGVSSLYSGSPTNITSTSYPNGWYRISFTFTASATASHSFVIYNLTANVNTWLAWGAQVERGSTATDYTPTTTTAISRVLPATTNTNITGLGTYYSSGFDENVGFTTFISANVFAPYDLVYDEFGGTLFGAGQGRYMRQNTDKSVIVYNEIDEVTDFRDIVRSGLVLDLDAGMNASYNGTGTTWYDLSGRSNTGTLTNGPTYSTANGGSIVFDGSNDYITSSFATTSGQAVTYCGWLYSTETTATYRNFVDSVTANPMIWWNTTGQIEFDAAFYTTPAVYRNQWVYVALSKPSGSSSASYYVNGVLVGSGTAYTTPALTPTWFNRAAAQTWKGNASNVQVYNRALTATEVSQNYNALRNRFGL